MRTALTIAGSDSSGGAGIQADIKTMTVMGVFAMSAVTSLTAQNTNGVIGIENVSSDFLAKQLDSVFTDIYPDAIKIGMVSSADLIEVIADKLKQYNAKNIVLDPVMVATSGSKLISDDAIEILQAKLFPLADIITPNISEAEVLTGLTITSHSDMKTAAEIIGEKFKCSVLVKGGHLTGNADDILYSPNKKIRWYCSKKIENNNTHGTGCTLSSAIASGLAKGEDMASSVAFAKAYLRGAIAYGMNLGAGRGPLAHNYKLIKKG